MSLSKKARQLVLSLIFLIVTFFIGTIGYRILEPSHSLFDSFYMTVITLSTVGYGEIHDLSSNLYARVFTVILILFGMANLLFALSAFTSLVMEGHLYNFIRRKKLKQKINTFNDHVIICGAGSTGLHILNELISTKREFVLIEKDIEKVTSIEERFPNIICIHGDATLDEVLKDAGIEKAKALACVLKDDKDNLFLSLTSKYLNPNLRIISKVINLENKKKLIRAGAEGVVPPQFIGALRMASELIRPRVVSFLDVMLRGKENIRIEEFVIKEDSWCIGKKLHELKLTEKLSFLAIAIKHQGDDVFDYCPNANDIIKKNTVIIGICSPDKTKKVTKYIT